MKIEKINELLSRGVTEVIVREHLEKELLSGKKLRVKFGIDPTGDLLHLGHAVALLKLKEFQELGHTIIFLIGDHTAEIGDPSGRSKERIPLTREQIKKNMTSYQEQTGKILDMKKVEVRYNSEWYDAMSIKEFMQLTSKITVSQVLQRADFKKRIQDGQDLSTREALYPILQGYDSVMLEADVEIGGTDQKFNLLMGRQVQKRCDQQEQDIVMVSLLEGLDGVEKMSKSSGNFIAIPELPSEMYNKLMSVPDSLIVRYFDLATRVPCEDSALLQKEIEGGANPRDIKMRLAREIVTQFHDATVAESAEKHFISVFQKKELPQNLPEMRVKKGEWNIVDLLLESKLATSKAEARRLIEQKGVVANEHIIDDIAAKILIPKDGLILQKGKRHFIRIVT